MYSSSQKSYYLSEYDRLANIYKSQGFSYKADFFLRKTLAEPRIQTLSSRTPIMKFLKTVIRKLLMNEFEMNYWACFFELYNWNFQEVQEFSQ